MPKSGDVSRDYLPFSFELSQSLENGTHKFGQTK